MKLLITGGLGHIGSGLIHGLRPDDYDEVVIMDNMLTQRYCSLFNLPEGVRFSFVEADILADGVKRYFEHVDVVVHLAAITDAVSSFENAGEVEKVNLEGTKRVAKICSEYGCKVIFLSTTSVYGTQADVVDEDCSENELRPQSPYAKSKLEAEQFLQSMGMRDHFKFIICRFGTIFGTSIGMRFHTAINKFIWQACTGRPLTVWRVALEQKRPYLYLNDALRAISFIIDHDCFDNDIYNVLTTNATVGQIVDVIRRHIPDLSVDLVDSRIMNQLSYEVSCEKFRALGFECKGSLNQGIAEIVDLIRNVRSK